MYINLKIPHLFKSNSVNSCKSVSSNKWLRSVLAQSHMVNWISNLVAHIYLTRLVLEPSHYIIELLNCFSITIRYIPEFDSSEIVNLAKLVKPHENCYKKQQCWKWISRSQNKYLKISCHWCLYGHQLLLCSHQWSLKKHILRFPVVEIILVQTRWNFLQTQRLRSQGFR